MAKITWDKSGERYYETGVDHGVLYVRAANGTYGAGVAWNGLTAVTEAPSGAEATPIYADNIKYLNLRSAEEFGATIEAYTYPDEFEQCDGSASPKKGVSIGQQNRSAFGLVYRTRLGNDLSGDDFGYKLHLVYGCTAAPSERAYATVNDSPEAVAFSWELTTEPVAVEGYKPTAILTLKSSELDPADLAAIEAKLFGDTATEPTLPTPDEVLALITTPVGG